jgi:hypothetical protein
MNGADHGAGLSVSALLRNPSGSMTIISKCKVSNSAAPATESRITASKSQTWTSSSSYRVVEIPVRPSCCDRGGQPSSEREHLVRADQRCAGSDQTRSDRIKTGGEDDRNRRGRRLDSRHRNRSSTTGASPAGLHNRGSPSRAERGPSQDGRPAGEANVADVMHVSAVGRGCLPTSHGQSSLGRLLLGKPDPGLSHFK